MPDVPAVAENTEDAEDTEELRIVRVYGGRLTEKITGIRQSYLTPVILLGNDGTDDVLVPLVEWSLKPEGEEEDEEDLFHCILHFGNAAFLIRDLCQDLSKSCEYMRRASVSGLSMAEDRTGYSIKQLTTAREYITQCIADLEQTLGVSRTAD